MIQPKLKKAISDKSEELIIELYNKIHSNWQLSSLQQRLLNVDKILSRVNPDESKVIVPIAAPLVDSRVAYLAKIFLSGSPIFPVGTSVEASDVIAQYNTLINKYSTDYQWRRNIMLALRDGVKYNLMAVEATWYEQAVQSPTNEVDDNGTLKGTTEKEKGFRVKHLDLYNTFFDTAVCPAEVSQYGDFAGYTQMLSSTKLTTLLASIPETNWKHRERDIWTAATQGSQGKYYYPVVSIKAGENTSHASYWDTMLSPSDSFRKTGIMGAEITTIYARIIPKEYGLMSPSPDLPAIFKFVIIGGKYVILAENRSSFHQFLPIIIGQPNEDNLGQQTKSLVEDVADIQIMASSMWNTEIESNNRTLLDRMVYDPSMISKDHLEGANTISKIPLTAKALGRNVNEAFAVLPFNDPARGSRAQLAAGLTSFANAAAGVNQVGQGQFVKGNKTDNQFDTVMANSDSRQIMMAVALEDQFFSVLKKLLKSDLLQYQTGIKIVDPNTGKELEIDPAAMREARVNFTLADGLIDLDQEFNTQSAIQFMQMIASNPELQMQYNSGALMSYLAKLQGMKDIGKFLRTPEQVAAIQNANTQREIQIAQETKRVAGG